MTGPAVRTVLVMDGDGQLVGSRPSWDEAHEWAHKHAVQASRQTAAALPVRVEDLSRRRTLEVWPDRCELLQWVRAPKADCQGGGCGHLRAVGPLD